MTHDTDVLRDITDGWHLRAALGLTSPTAAGITDSLGALLALTALTFGHRRPATTLTATSAASAIAAVLIH
jgi:hypothetical protein